MESARIKKNVKRMQIEVPLDTESINYDKHAKEVSLHACHSEM